MKQRIIESVVAFVFGLTILLTAYEGYSNSVIVMGAILAVVGLGCFIWACVDQVNVENEINALEKSYCAKLVDAEAKLTQATEEIVGLREVVYVKDKEIKSLKSAAKKAAKAEPNPDEVPDNEKPVKTTKTRTKKETIVE